MHYSLFRKISDIYTPQKMSLISLSQRFSLYFEFEEIYDITTLFRMESGRRQTPVLHMQVYLNMCHKYYYHVFMVILHSLYAE